jgi:hypothetical protein
MPDIIIPKKDVRVGGAIATPVEVTQHTSGTQINQKLRSITNGIK